jgi:hypothetical protein
MPAVIVLLLVIGATPSAAQSLVPWQQTPSVITPPAQPNAVNLSGPRFGVTSLTDGALAKAREVYPDVQPVITQFGWQFEKQFYASGSGLAMLSEWVLLLGGLEQNVALPSLSWMVGARTANGTEFGVGPNLTAAGWSLAFAAGTTFRAGFLNVPVNIAVVPSKSGMRVSFLTGFSKRN